MDSPEGFDPPGTISFRIALPPVSQQARRAAKDAFTRACRERMNAFPLVLYGEVKLGIVWNIHEEDRYETGSAPDVDNILKPLIDALKGPGAILIDDCQLQEINCRWIDTESRAQSVCVTIHHELDEWFKRGALRFVEIANCLCMPLAPELPAHGQLLMLELWETMFKARDTLLASNWDWYAARGVMPIIRPFHKSRIAGKFPIVTLEQLRRELMRLEAR